MIKRKQPPLIPSDGQHNGLRRTAMPKPKPTISGQRYGRLVVLEDLGTRPVGNSTKRFAKVRCDCGEEIEAVVPSMRSGNTLSCGCLRSEAVAKKNLKHGHTADGQWSASYISWSNMLGRCRNKRHPDYHYYGGRGITVCDRWLSFTAFLQDMGERPAGLSIDRIDNDGNYEPGNCRWATQLEQVRNSRPRGSA